MASFHITFDLLILPPPLFFDYLITYRWLFNVPSIWAQTMEALIELIKVKVGDYNEMYTAKIKHVLIFSFFLIPRGRVCIPIRRPGNIALAGKNNVRNTSRFEPLKMLCDKYLPAVESARVICSLYSVP